MPYQAGLEQQPAPQQQTRSREEELQLLLEDVRAYQADFENNELAGFSADQVRILEDRIRGAEYNVAQAQREYDELKLPDSVGGWAWWGVKALNPVSLFTTHTYQVSSWLSGATEAMEKSLEADRALLAKYKERLESYRTEVGAAETTARELSTAARDAIAEAERLPFGAQKQEAVERAIMCLEQTRERMFVPIGDLSAEWRAAMNGTLDANGNRTGGVNEMFARADQHFDSQLSTLRTVRNGCIVVVATLPVAVAAAGGTAVGVVALGGLAIQGAIAGTVAGGAMSVIEQAGHVAHGNKDSDQAISDFGTQTWEDAQLATKTSVMAAAGFGTAGAVLRGGTTVVGAVLPKAVAANPIAIALGTRAVAGAAEGFVSTSVDLAWSSVDTANEFDANYDWANNESFQQSGEAFRDAREDARLTIGQVVQRYATNMGISSITSVLGNVIRPEQAKTVAGYWGRQALEGGVMGTVSLGAAGLDGEISHDEMVEVGFHTFMGQYVNGKIGVRNFEATRAAANLPPVDTSTTATRRQSLDTIAEAAAERRTTPAARPMTMSQDAAVGEHLAALGLNPDGRYRRRHLERARDKQISIAERTRRTDPAGADRRIREVCAACETLVEHRPAPKARSMTAAGLRENRIKTDTYRELGAGDTLAERVAARGAYQSHIAEGLRSLGLKPEDTLTPSIVKRALDARVAQIRAAQGKGSVAEAEVRDYAALVTEHSRHSSTATIAARAERIEARATAVTDRRRCAETLGLNTTKWPTQAQVDNAITQLRDSDAYRNSRSFRVDAEAAAAYFRSSSTDPLLASGARSILSDFASYARVRETMNDFELALGALDLTRASLLKRDGIFIRTMTGLTSRDLFRRASTILSDYPGTGPAVRAAAAYVSDVVDSGILFSGRGSARHAEFQPQRVRTALRDRYTDYLSKDRAFEILGRRTPSDFLASRGSSADPNERAAAAIEARRELVYNKGDLDTWRTERLAQIRREGLAISRAELDAAHEYLLRQITPETPTGVPPRAGRRSVWESWGTRWFFGHPLNALRFAGTELKALWTRSANLFPLDSVDFVRRVVPQRLRDRAASVLRWRTDQEYAQVREGPSLDELVAKYRSLEGAREVFGQLPSASTAGGVWARFRTFIDPEWGLTARRNELLHEHRNDPEQCARIREAHETLHSESRRRRGESWAGWIGHTLLSGYRAWSFDLSWKIPGYYMVYNFINEYFSGEEGRRDVEILNPDGTPTGIRIDGAGLPLAPGEAEQPSGARLPRRPWLPEEPEEDRQATQPGGSNFDSLNMPRRRGRSTTDDYNDFNSDPIYEGRK